MIDGDDQRNCIALEILLVMAGLVPAMTSFFPCSKAWMPGSSSAKTRFCPGMTEGERHSPICLEARSFMISSVPPPMALTLTSR